MASGSDRDTKDALSKLLQMGTVTEYESKFVILANRVTGISANLLKPFYILGLKPALQCALLKLNPKTVDEAFSLSRATKARFTNLKLLEFLKSNPSTLGEAFFKARITKARFEDERSIIDIAKTNDLKAGVQVQDLEEMIRHMPNKVESFQTSMVATFEEHEQQENQDNLNENFEEKHNAKPPISTDTFGSNGDNDSRTSCSETPVKELVDNGIKREVVVGLPGSFKKEIWLMHCQE
ncbi:hypothetical protein Tco_1003870 [Tanacetum coccineum]|uniref:Uncharacterized protein n=1 Tax=Tanacetum coccineum TaxID=301880 RepID=A0ABQ5FCL0_9ASTR